jgi:hypothetical protein
MKLRELDVCQELASLHNVGEATESVVEILHRRSISKTVRKIRSRLPFEDDFTVTDLVFEELVQLYEGEFFGQVSDEDSLWGASDHATPVGLRVLLEGLGELGLLDEQIKAVDRVCKVKHCV